VGCTNRQQNAHITERRVVLYRWHPWHGREVSISSFTARAGAVILRCRVEEDSCRSIEVPAWMFDAATCCRIRLESAPVVTCAALLAVRELLDAVAPISATPIVQPEHPIIHPGAAHAIQEPRTPKRSTSVVPTDGAPTMERDARGGACPDSSPPGADVAPACPPRSEVAP
jgi:hypothetical protein